MLKYIIQRPIAVLLIFLGLIGLGLVTVQTLSVSLLPDVPIPNISVQISYPNTSARTLENTVVKTIRQQLMQVGHLKDIHSHTQDEFATITLDFDFGTNTDYAFIEVNEKIDQITAQLPREMARPQVVKANITDIPVFYLSVVPKIDTNTDHLALSEFTTSVIKRRLEQLPEVAFADVSGTIKPELLITPDAAIFQSLGWHESDLERIIQQNNINLGSFLIQDGHYQYHVRFSSELSNKTDIENIYINVKGRILQLKDIAKVSLRPQTLRGKYLYDDKSSIVLVIRKQSDAQLFALKKNITQLLHAFENDYPQLNFQLSNDQTKLLSVSIDNLRTSLYYGAFFAFLVMFLFFKSWKSPLLIGIVIPVALIITLLCFYFLKISINIISLSGLILGIGLMIDNAIIVIENIRQYLQQGETTLTACVKGTNEVIKPLISSALTTCSVFVPLIFLSGISGALFYDQAISIALALGVSLIAAYFLLPTLFLLFFNDTGQKNTIISPPKSWRLLKSSVDFVLKHRFIFLLFIGGFIYFGVLIFNKIPKTTFPKLSKKGLEINIDWNENINITENERRVLGFLKHFEKDIKHANTFIGEKQFLLSHQTQDINEANILLETSTVLLLDLERNIYDFFQKEYPTAIIKQRPLQSFFDQIFGGDSYLLTAHLQTTNSNKTPNIQDIKPLITFLRNNNIPITIPSEVSQYYISIDRKKALIYDISYNEIYNKLKYLFNDFEIGTLQTSSQHIPIITSNLEHTFFKKINDTQVYNTKKQPIPLHELVTLQQGTTLKAITARKGGESLDIQIGQLKDNLIPEIKSQIGKELTVRFSGQFFENKKTIYELSIVFSVALILLYLILAAQFESIIQPFIVLLTVPIGILGSLLLLWFVGETINLMSIIGIIVMSGIVINDAILKTDMINRLSPHTSTITAIHKAGARRLKPILMTSITTILALLPILFSQGLGAELQRPLAYAVIGGLVFGTLASLYIVPVLYLIFSKNKD